MSKLVHMKIEDLNGGCAWFGYFDGTPTEVELKIAYHSTKSPKLHGHVPPNNNPSFGGTQHDDMISKLANLERWWLGWND